MDMGETGSDNDQPPGKLKRVAVSVFRYFPQGGIQMKLLNLVKELASDGIRVVVFCITCDMAEEIPGVEFRTLPAKGLTRYGKARRFNALLQEVLEKEKFDLHIAFSKVSGADWYFADSSPFTCESARSRWYHKYMPWYRTFAALEKAVFAPESSTKIICFSVAQQQEFQKLYATQGDRIYIMPPGIDPEYRNALAQRENRRKICRKKLNVSMDDKVLLTVASAARAKGVDRAIAALASLPGAERSCTRLYVAGWGDMLKFKQLARRLGVETQVKFCGWVDDIETLYSGADLVLHPARRESSGAVLLESIACGTPVVCSGNCGFADSVSDSGGEVLGVPFRQKQLNRTLLMLLSVPGKLEELQFAAAEYAATVDFFSRSKAMAELLKRSFSDVQKSDS